MTEEEFAVGVDAILLTGERGHMAHRALDLWWTRYAMELPESSPIRRATEKWMAAIEGDHRRGRPYPLGRRWWQRRPRPVEDNSSGWTSMQCP